MNCALSEPRMSPITANATADTASAQQEATKSRSRWTPARLGGGAVEAADAAIGLPLGVRSCGESRIVSSAGAVTTTDGRRDVERVRAANAGMRDHRVRACPNP